MKHLRNSGFTVIETMLFLGLTGFLTIGIMAGTSMQIGTQRYRDAVSSFQLDLQQVYADVENVQNTRSGNAACAGNPAAPRGQSGCIMVGKLLSVGSGSDGGVMTTMDIIANPSGEVRGSDIVKLQSEYTYVIDRESTQTKKMPWGTAIAWPREGAGARGGDRAFAMLVIRSPESGFTYTFTRDTLPGEAAGNDYIRQMIRDGASGELFGRQKRTLCIAPSGLTVAETMSIQVGRYASNSNAVESLSNEALRSSGVTTQC